MNKIRVLHTADLHIDSPLSALGRLANIRQAELLDTFGKIIDIAKSEKVNIVIISGDLFDNRNPSKMSVNYVENKLAEISDIKVFIALGNHDAGLNINFPDNVHVFDRTAEKVEFDNFDIYGVSFENEQCVDSLIKDFTIHNPSKINILSMHGDLIENGQTSQYNAVTKEMIASFGADYAAFGHVHQFSGINKVNNTHYAYSGTPEGRGFDELGPKGVIIGDVYKNHVELNFVPVSKRECIEIDVDISDCSDYNDICNKICGCALGENNLFKINLTGYLEDCMFIDTEFIRDRIKDNYFYVKIKDFTRPKIDIDSLSKEFSLKGLFVKKLIEQEGSEEALKIGLSAIAGEKVFFE